MSVLSVCDIGVLWPNGWMDQDETWHARGHIALVGDPAPFPQRGTAPQFSAHVYCGQTAGWIKMPFCMEVGLGPGHIVLVGDPAPLSKKMPLGMEVGFGPGHIVLDGDPGPLPPKKGGTAPSA